MYTSNSCACAPPTPKPVNVNLAVLWSSSWPLIAVRIWGASLYTRNESIWFPSRFTLCFTRTLSSLPSSFQSSTLKHPLLSPKRPSTRTTATPTMPLLSSAKRTLWRLGRVEVYALQLHSWPDISKGTTNMHCAETCQANKVFKVSSIATYDKDTAPYANWFVGYDSSASEIIVSLADVGPEDLYVGLHTFAHMMS